MGWEALIARVGFSVADDLVAGIVDLLDGGRSPEEVKAMIKDMQASPPTKIDLRDQLRRILLRLEDEEETKP